MAELGRSLPQFLENIVVWAERLGRFLEGVSEKAFAGDELRQAGASKCIEAIGEAAGEIERRYTDAIDWRRLWRISTHHVPMLLAEIFVLRNRYGADR